MITQVSHGIAKLLFGDSIRVTVAENDQTFITCVKSKTFMDWYDSGQTKITLYAKDLEEFEDILSKSKAARIDTLTITDAGRTEFKGVPTVTCAVIGPEEGSKLNPITGHCQLI